MFVGIHLSTVRIGRPSTRKAMVGPPLSGNVLIVPALITPGIVRSAFQHLIVKSNVLGIFLKLWTSRGELRRQHLLRSEARVDRLQAHETAEQQSRAREEYNRQSNFGNDQCVSQAGLRRILPAVPRPLSFIAS